MWILCRAEENRSFITKTINAYNNLINKNNDKLIDNIIIYSINETIIKDQRYAYQYLNINILKRICLRASHFAYASFSKLRLQI